MRLYCLLLLDASTSFLALRAEAPFSFSSDRALVKTIPTRQRNPLQVEYRTQVRPLRKFIFGKVAPVTVNFGQLRLKIFVSYGITFALISYIAMHRDKFWSVMAYIKANMLSILEGKRWLYSAQCRITHVSSTVSNSLRPQKLAFLSNLFFSLHLIFTSFFTNIKIKFVGREVKAIDFSIKTIFV